MAKLKQRVTFKELKASGMLPWGSWKTTKRKIDGEGFPAYWESNHYYFDMEEVEMWFKKRKVNPKAA